MARASIIDFVGRLIETHGAPDPPPALTVFEMVLYENVAYLVGDAQRDRAFEQLRSSVGTKPAEILRAKPSQWAPVERLAGMNRARQIDKLVRAAQIVETEFDGDLDSVLALPVAKARAALKKFPAIAEPGADKILLHARAAASLAPESNGLRVLTRAGYGAELPNYLSTYRSAMNAVGKDLPEDLDWLIAARSVLRTHGRSVCRRTAPQCSVCNVRSICDYGSA